MNTKISYKTICICLLCVIAFFPTYLFGDNAAKGQVVQFFLFPVILLILWILISALKKNYKLNMPVLGAVMFGAGSIFLFTLASKVAFINGSLFINHLRYFAYATVLTLSYGLAYKMNARNKDLATSLYVVAFFSFVFVVLQLIFPNSPIVELLSQKPALDHLGFRIGGPFEWSYIFCFCMISTIFMGMHSFVRGEGSLLVYCITILVLSTYLLSQSKAAYIALLTLSMIWCCFCLFVYKNNFRLIFGIIVVLCFSSIVVATYWDMFSHIIGFIEKIVVGEVDASTSTRIKQFQFAEYTLDYNLLMGYPIKYLVIENAYVHYFYNYGFVGMLVYFFSALCFFGDSCFRLKMSMSQNDSLGVALGIGMVAFTASVFIFALGASPTDANKASYFFYFVYGSFIAVSCKEYVRHSVRFSEKMVSSGK
ncbi:hypothetical protein [Vibrio sp. CUB2]|uniref:hypothetical protein n=1 Tax=Vibrio sp. CUB2 TaxID=2315233 RepID=UPI00076A65B3|nr:hypothetical protein [Vibrio sp. CUB2]